MRAAYVEALGPATDIRVGALPAPTAGPGEVLVRVQLAGVNHVDVFVRSGAYATRVPLPLILGRDLVGTVVALGDGVERFRPGQPVWCNSLGHDGRQGSFAELAAVPADRLYRLPAGVDPLDAIVVAHTAATAHLGLFREAGLVAGETVLVAGAGGGVGSAVVQFAASAGGRVVALDRADNAVWCARGGAEAFVARDDEQRADLLRDLAPDGYDVIWDCSGRHELDLLLGLAALRGRVVLAAGFSERPALPVGAVYTRDVRLLGFAMSNAPVSDLAQAARAVNDGLAAGWLRGRVRAVLPLVEARCAHEMQERRQATDPPGRVVVEL